VSLTIDFQEHFVQMPAPLTRFYAGNSAFSRLRGKHRTEPVQPVHHSLMTDIDAALVQQILDISKGQRETDVHHRRKADKLTACFEVAKWVGFGNPVRLGTRPARLKLVLTDSGLPDDLSTGFEAAECIRFGRLQTILNRLARLKLICSYNALSFQNGTSTSPVSITFLPIGRSIEVENLGQQALTFLRGILS
jgi:hypothetical protein